MSDIASNYKWIDSCVGVELRGQHDDTYGCNFCAVTVNKNALTIGETGQSTGKIDEIIDNIPGSKGFALVMDGKGVLTKKTSKLDTLSQEKFNALFPNFKLEQFYTQNFITGDYSYVSIIKRKELDDVVSSFLVAGKRVLTVSLGPFPVALVLSQLNTYGNEIVFNGHQVQYNEARVWEDYKYVPGLLAKYKIKAGIETLQEKVLLPYAAAFQLALYHQLPVINANIEYLSDDVSALTEKKSFMYKAVVLGGIFLLLLILNSLVFRFFDSKNMKLAAIVSESTASIENTQQLLSKLEKREQLLAAVGGKRRVNYAFLAGELGRTVPASVLLNELIINPESGNKGDNNARTYANGQLTIKGTCSSLQQVNDWISDLDEVYWVKLVQLENFSPSEDRSSDQFLIRINY